MRRKSCVIISLAILLIFSTSGFIILQLKPIESDIGESVASISFSITIGNTTFYAANEGTEQFRGLTPVLEFENFSSFGPLGEIWFHQPDMRYVSNSFQGGINEYGLWTESNDLPLQQTNTHSDDEDWTSEHWCPMNECIDVEEIISYFETHNYHILGDCMDKQMHFADSSGDAVVVSISSDGETAFTRKTGNALVAANFNLNNTENRYGCYPCERYDTCIDLLSEIETEESLTVEAIRDVLEATCIPDQVLYSYIVDPVEMKWYIFYPHDFTKMFEFDFYEEMELFAAQGGDNEVQYNITELFEQFSPPEYTPHPHVSVPDSTVYWPTSEWYYSTPEQQGMNSTILKAMMDRFEYLSYQVDSVIVVRHGRIIFEDSVTGYHPIGRHITYSVTKSVTSTLIGIAIDNGLIANLSQRMIDFFPEREIANLDDRKRNITLEHLLTMTSGYDWDEWRYPYEHPLNPCTQTWTSDDPIQHILDLPMVEEPGIRWRYDSGAVILLGAILEQVSGMDVTTFTRNYLFTPLGIGESYWLQIRGVHLTEGGLILSPWDLARFGYLILNNGIWDGQQIVSSEWISQATSPIVDRQDPNYSRVPNYGYLWWISSTGNSVVALGRGSQAICIVPELDLMAVFMANDETFDPTHYFEKYILGAVIDGTSQFVYNYVVTILSIIGVVALTSIFVWRKGK